MATPANIALRFRDDDRQLIRALQAVTGLDMTAVIRLSLREAALSRGIPLPQPTLLAPAVEPEPEEKRPRGRPRTRPEPDPAAPKKPRGRPKKQG